MRYYQVWQPCELYTFCTSSIFQYTYNFVCQGTWAHTLCDSIEKDCCDWLRVAMQLSLIVLPGWIGVTHSACDLESDPANTLSWSRPSVLMGYSLLRMSGGSSTTFRWLIIWRHKLKLSYFTKMFNMPGWSGYLCLRAKRQGHGEKYCQSQISPFLYSISLSDSHPSTPASLYLFLLPGTQCLPHSLIFTHTENALTPRLKVSSTSLIETRGIGGVMTRQILSLKHYGLQTFGRKGDF